MRKIIIGLLLFVSTQIYSQTQEVVVEFNKLAIGETFAFGDYEIEFADVASDSRCPKGVICVQAGAAIAKVVIYKSGKRIEAQKITFTPNTYFPNNKGNLFNSESLKITSIELLPYPRPETQIIKDNYHLKLIIEEVVE